MSAGSKADSCSAATDVRFAPNNDRKSRLSKEFVSALPPKADMCSAKAYVCYGPIADISPYSMTPEADVARVICFTKLPQTLSA